MSCAYEEHLTAYVDRELPALTLRRLEAHLPTCSSCRETEALLRRTVGVVGALSSPEPSADLRRAVLTGLPEAPDRVGVLELFRRGWFAPAMGLAAAAAVAVVVTARSGGELRADDPDQLLVAQNMDVLDDYELLGLDSPDDVELVSRLHEVETP